MAKKPAYPNRKKPSSDKLFGKTRKFAGKKINAKLGLESSALRLIKLYELSQKKRESRNILRLKLQRLFLKSLIVRTMAEEQILTLAAETSTIENIVSRYKPNRIPLSEGLKLHQAALKVLNIAIHSRGKGSIARENFEKMAREMEKTRREIKEAVGQNTIGHLEMKNQQKFLALVFVGSNLIRNTLQTRGVDEYTKIGFEEIERVVEKTLKEAKQ